jgi:hypothetical protein
MAFDQAAGTVLPAPYLVTLAPGRPSTRVPDRPVAVAVGHSITLTPGRAIRLAPGHAIRLALGRATTLASGRPIALDAGAGTFARDTWGRFDQRVLPGACRCHPGRSGGAARGRRGLRR